MASVSALGNNDQQIWMQYLSENHSFKNKTLNGIESLVSGLSDNNWNTVNRLKESPQFKNLDPSVLLAIEVSRKAVAKVSWNNKSFGVILDLREGLRPYLKNTTRNLYIVKTLRFLP